MSLTLNRVDAHVHFWHPQILNYPWLAGLPALHRPYLPADYAAATAGLGIGKMVFVEAGCAPAASVAEAEWVAGLVAAEPRLKAIVAQAAVEKGVDVLEELAALAAVPLVRGVRRNLQGETDPEFCVHQDFLAGVGALAGYQFTFDICIRHQQLAAVTEMVRRCPEVFFVLDHGAKPAIRDGSLDPWRQHLRELSHLPNVACKISGLVTEARAGHAGPEVLRPYVTHILECFEFGRVMFGGDWPVCLLASPYADWQAALQTSLAGVSEADLVKFYQTNAELVYRI